MASLNSHISFAVLFAFDIHVIYNHFAFDIYNHIIYNYFACFLKLLSLLLFLTGFKSLEFDYISMCKVKKLLKNINK